MYKLFAIINGVLFAFVLSMFLFHDTLSLNVIDKIFTVVGLSNTILGFYLMFNFNKIYYKHLHNISNNSKTLQYSEINNYLNKYTKTLPVWICILVSILFSAISLSLSYNALVDVISFKIQQEFNQVFNDFDDLDQLLEELKELEQLLDYDTDVNNLIDDNKDEYKDVEIVPEPEISPILNYDLSFAPLTFKDIEIIDFISFVTDGEYYTEGSSVAKSNLSDTYEFKYESQYERYMSSYINALKEDGFSSANSGYEGYNTFKKTINGKVAKIGVFYDEGYELVTIQITVASEVLNLSSAEIENQVTSIRAIYNDIVGKIGSFYKVDKNNSVQVHYENGMVRYIKVERGYNGYPYSRFYYFDGEILVFAFFESTDSHRLYFHNENLFRWRYTNTSGTATNYEYTNTEDYLNLEKFALEEASSFF